MTLHELLMTFQEGFYGIDFRKGLWDSRRFMILQEESMTYQGEFMAFWRGMTLQEGFMTFQQRFMTLQEGSLHTRRGFDTPRRSL